MKPIRGERKREVAHDPWHLRERQLQQEESAHIVSDDGGLESYHTGRHFASGCGCLRRPGGFCAVCDPPETACVECFGLCRHCSKPLCRRHSVFVEGQSGQGIRLCSPCFDSSKRKQLVRQIGRLLLSPFVGFESRHDPR